MLKIGDFSKLSQLSVKTLRYYDDLGLLKPAEVDRFTGYRYYTAEQFLRLNRIVALKDLGFPLEQIRQLLDEELPVAQMRGMLRLRQAETEQKVEAEVARLARVEARLRQIEQEGRMPPYEVVLKKVDAKTVASVREVAPTYSDIGRLIGKVFAYLGQQGIRPEGPPMGIYHDPEYRERDVDIEACVPITGPAQGGARVGVRELPAVEAMVSVVHQDSYDTISQAYAALMAWIEANGYRIAGPSRETYLRGPEDAGRDQASYVTEVQFPVEKA